MNLLHGFSIIGADISFAIKDEVFQEALFIQERQFIDKVGRALIPSYFAMTILAYECVSNIILRKEVSSNSS